ncbi:ABC transporter substrate-binding protein [Streptomyces sp. ZYX-F-203]
MTRRQTLGTPTPRLRRPARGRALATAALVACASAVLGCGTTQRTAADGTDGTITVMTWAPQGTGATNKPGMPALAGAYARWVNERGGVDGRRLTVSTCNDHNDGVSAAKCARRAVEEGAVAVVGSYSQHPDSFFPILEGAGIPYIGGYGITNAEFTSPLSYPVNGGQPTLLAGLGTALAEDCGPVTMVRPDTIAGDQLPALLDSGLRAGDHETASDHPAPEDATEYADHSRRALAGATSGAGGTEGCVVPVLGDRTDTFMDSFRRSRADFAEVRTGTVLGSADQSTINAAGGDSSPYEGSYITSWYPVATDARWEPMREVIQEEAFGDNRVDPADAGVQTTWIAYRVLHAALSSLEGGEATPRTVAKALDSGLEVDTGGLTPLLRWEFDNKLSPVGFPRLVNTDVTIQIVRDGRLVAAREGSLDTAATLLDADVI